MDDLKIGPTVVPHPLPPAAALLEIQIKFNQIPRKQFIITKIAKLPTYKNALS
jgi:hypothetical protein